MHEVLDDIIRWVAAVYKEEVLVLDALGEELLAIVFGFVQTDYFLDVPLLEYLRVLFRCHSTPLILILPLHRPHKRSKLPWYYPIYISILHSLIELIFLSIESAYIIPPFMNSKFQPLQTMQHSALIVTVTLGRISERLDVLVVQ